MAAAGFHLYTMSGHGKRPVRSFHLRGVLEDARVEASWDGDVLAVSSALLARAKLAVDVDHAMSAVAQEPFPSTLEGPAELVLLTLVRACDELELVQYDGGIDSSTAWPNQS